MTCAKPCVVGGFRRELELAVSLGEKPSHRPEDDNGWLETERREGSMREARRPVGVRTSNLGRKWQQGVATPQQARPPVPRRDQGRNEQTDAIPGQLDPPGVRASIVAKKPGNSEGAKGRRKMDAG